MEAPKNIEPAIQYRTGGKELIEAIRKSIEDKKKALLENKIIFKDGNTKI